jgi:SAM-dependent methyltransferase
MTQHFVTRGECPACDRAASAMLVSVPMDRGPVFEFLERYYTKQGRFEPEYLAGASYTVAECEGCGLMWQTEVPNDAFLARLYGVWIDNAGVAERSNEKRGNKIGQFAREMEILRWLGGGRRLKVLDFGSGQAKWPEAAAVYGHDAFACELERGRMSASPELYRFVEIDDLPGQRFDFINTNQVFEHLTRPAETLARLVEALAPGGVIRLAVPTSHNQKKLLLAGKLDFRKHARHGLGPVAPLQHVNCYPPSALDALAGRAGLERLRVPLGVQILSNTQWMGEKRWLSPKLIGRNLLHPVYSQLRFGPATTPYFRRPA